MAIDTIEEIATNLCIGCGGKPEKTPTNCPHCGHQTNTKCVCRPWTNQKIQELIILSTRYKEVTASARQARDAYRELKEKYTVLLLDLQLAVVSQGCHENILLGQS